MNMSKCLACYKSLEANQVDFHPSCSKRLFETKEPPKVEFSLSHINDLARKLVQARLAIPGVQPKLSIDREIRRGRPSADNKTSAGRLTMMSGSHGLSGHYILKPPTERYPHLPEIEDATMHLASICKIRIAAHSLIRLRSGELAYLTKRFDRVKNSKLAMEDMAQITEVLTENKYNSSLERVGKAIKRHSHSPGIDVVNFLDVVVFCYLTGNADMHLKNFSLLTEDDGLTGLSPAYDLVATKLVMPTDMEETALPINGKKKNLKPKDFYMLAESLGVTKILLTKRMSFFESKIGDMIENLQASFLSKGLIDAFGKLIRERAVRLGIGG